MTEIQPHKLSSALVAIAGALFFGLGFGQRAATHSDRRLLIDAPIWVLATLAARKLTIAGRVAGS